MADDLTARLRVLAHLAPSWPLREAADRIEALEAERDAALADVAKLREAIEAHRESARATGIVLAGDARLWIVLDDTEEATSDG